MSKKDSLYQPGGHIEEVPGVTVGWKWAGRNQAGNRRSIPPNYFWTIDNIRLEDDDVIGRKGLTKVNSADASDTSCVIGITDLPAVSSKGRFFITLGFDTGNVDLYVFDPKFDDTQLLDVDPDAGAADGEFLIKYKGNIYTDFGTEITLRESGGTLRSASGEQIIFPTPRNAADNISLFTGAGSQAVVAPTIETQQSTLLRRQEQGEDPLLDLYFVSPDGVAGAEVPYRWDGNQAFQLATAAEVGNDELQHAGYLREQIFVVVSPSVEGNPCIYYRDFAGDWNAVNCPALGQVVSGQFVCMGITYYNDEALLHGFQEGAGGSGTAYATVLKWDGTSLTVGTEIAADVGTGEGAIRGIFDATVYNGNYYYGYQERATGDSYLGRYNGSTFADQNVALNLKIATGFGPVGMAGRGGLFLLTAYDHANDFDTKAYKSTDLSTFTEVTIENGSGISIGVPHKVVVL